MVGVSMKFCASRMYCKYVINTLNNALKKIRIKKYDSKLLEDELYESYLKLEKLFNEEIS